MNTSPKSSIRISLNRESPRFRAALIAASGAALILLAAVSLCAGAVPIDLRSIWAVISGADTDSKAYQIFQYVRLPRTLAAALAGGALACAGTVLQTVLNNALASPNVIGVNAGAGLFAIILSALFPQWLGFSPLAAFLGALIAAALVYLIAVRTGASRMTIVLAGVAVSSILSAFTDTILTLYPDAQAGRTEFLIGSFSGVTMDNVKLAGACILFGIAACLVLSYDMNVLSLGDSTAMSLGMRTGVYRMIFLILAALLAGSAVSFSGLIGFVGLIVPHAARFLAGRDNRVLIPLCALLGGAFTLGCDILARVLFAPYELPVGIVMSFLGGPFFLYLLLRQKRGRLLD